MIPPIDRDDIHIISRNSNWPERSVHNALNEHVYTDPEAWKKFLKTFFICLGVGFTTSGIVFFFAYNWDELSNFVKIGLMEGLVVLATCATLFLKINLVYRNVILTGAAILVGVLFAIFGQVYQTGANAYDFFLSWTACIALWALVANFPPLWMIFIILVNTTFILFLVQVSHEWPAILVFTLLFAINVVYLAVIMLASWFLEGVSVPAWFRNTTALYTALNATIMVCIGVTESMSDSPYRETHTGTFLLGFLLALASYTGAILYSIKVKSGFFISLVLFSMVVILACLLLNASQSSVMYLFTSMFVIGSVTGIIAALISLHKKWSHG